jgi:hypothetical protein
MTPAILVGANDCCLHCPLSFMSRPGTPIVELTALLTNILYYFILTTPPLYNLRHAENKCI